MKIVRRTVGDVTILAFAGVFDAFNTNAVSESLDPMLETDGARVVINLRQLQLIDSSALGYLIRTHKRLPERGGKLVIAEPSPFFHSTITRLGLDRIFEVFPSEAEAVAHFAG